MLLVVAAVAGHAGRDRRPAAVLRVGRPRRRAAPAACPSASLGFGFLLVLGLAVAETSQITGALLVFALLVTPAATAQLLTSRPGLGVALSVAIALAVTWLGLALAYYSIYPVGFYVTSLAFGALPARPPRPALGAPGDAPSLTREPA